MQFRNNQKNEGLFLLFVKLWTRDRLDGGWTHSLKMNFLENKE